jgi:hypothetical protein
VPSPLLRLLRRLLLLLRLRLLPSPSTAINCQGSPGARLTAAAWVA